MQRFCQERGACWMLFDSLFSDGFVYAAKPSRSAHCCMRRLSHYFRVNKKLCLLLLSLSALPLFWMIRQQPADGTASVPGPSSPPVHPASREVAPEILTALPDTPQLPSPAPAPAAPKNVRELNQLADGPLPLHEKVRMLTGLMSSGPPDIARAAAVRAVFVVKNADYTAILGPVLQENRIRPEAMEVLALNLYDRPLDVRLSLWARLAELPQHPLAQEAVDGLEFHLREKSSLRGPSLAQAIKECLDGKMN